MDNNKFDVQLRRLNSQLVNEQNGIVYRSILITSSVGKEGKTTVVTALGERLAVDEHKTILVDGSSDNPSLHKIYDLKGSNDIAMRQNNEAGIKDSVVKTHIENLDVFPKVGSTDIAMNRSKVSSFMADLKKLYQVVIFDSSALSLNADALIFAPHVDGVILVVESHRTKWQTVERSVEQLQGIRANLLGVVLNKQQHFIPDFLYKRL